MTDGELRQAFLAQGPAWIRAQAVQHGARAVVLTPPAAGIFRPFFVADVDRARLVVAAIENPPFYADLLAADADARDLLNFAAGTAGITFDTTIVIAPGAELKATLLFHELVHVVQYRLLGVDRFAELYIDGWQGGIALRDDAPQAVHEHSA